MKPFKTNALFTALTVLLLLSLPLISLAEKLNAEIPEKNSSEEAAQLFVQGREAFEMGRISDAIVYFDKAVQKDAQSAVAWLYKALTAETDTDRKIGIDKAVLFRNNANEEERILIDIELTFADKNSEKRFQLAKQLAEMHPEDARSLLLLASEYQHLGKISQFRDLASEAIRGEPGSPLGYRALAASWLLNDPVDFSLAEKYMQKFVELRPNEASAHIALGDVYRAFLNLEKAKAAYSKTIELEPQNAAALSKRGYIHTYQGMFEEARADFKKASALASPMRDYSRPDVSMFSYLFSGNEKLAATNTEPASNIQNKNKRFPLNGNSDNCYFCCTFISMTHGFITSPVLSLSPYHCLRREFNRESRVPDETTIEANIAFVEGFRAIQHEKYDKAKQIIGEYARTVSPEMKPKKNEAHNYLAGLIHYGKGNYSNALASFKKSDTGNIFVKYSMGLVYDKLGMHEKANKALTEVAEFNFANACNTQMAKAANGWLESFSDVSLTQK
ncbi:MAG: tetratricopeptide repeat protein [Bacteroidota bacterium]